MSKELKKKYYYDFLSYFRYLKYAGLIISGDFYKQRVKQMTQEISEAVNNFITQGAALLKNVIDETEGNLYSIAKEDRETYMTGILKDFINIAPYLNYTTDKKYGKEYGKKIVKIGDKSFPGCIDDCHELIIKYELKYTNHFDDLSNPEKYIILCFHAYRDFFNQLNTIFFNFNIEIMHIQQSMNLQIWSREIIIQNNSVLKIGVEQINKVKTDRPLSVKQIALYHVYNEIQITRGNADEIAAKYGYTSKTSGEGLFQDYILFCSAANRKAVPSPCTSKKLQNKINFIESVIKLLPENKQGRAKDEVAILHSYYNSEYQ